jgi:small subunit ribosomal protein S13
MGGSGKKVKDLDKGKEPEKKEAEKKPEEKKPRFEKKEAKALVRVVNTDLDADKSLSIALLGIKGIGQVLSKAICLAGGFSPKAKLGSLSETDLRKLEDIIHNPGKFGIPEFFLNRRREPETGETHHLIGPDLTVRERFDIQKYVDLKTYRGWRHIFGQPVRGQRTKAHFRQKGRVVGVMRKSVMAQMGKTGEAAKAGAAPAPAAAAPAKKEEKK